MNVGTINQAIHNLKNDYITKVQLELSQQESNEIPFSELMKMWMSSYSLNHPSQDLENKIVNLILPKFDGCRRGLLDLAKKTWDKAGKSFFKRLLDAQIDRIEKNKEFKCPLYQLLNEKNECVAYLYPTISVGTENMSKLPDGVIDALFESKALGCETKAPNYSVNADQYDDMIEHLNKIFDENLFSELSSINASLQFQEQENNPKIPDGDSKNSPESTLILFAERLNKKILEMETPKSMATLTYKIIANALNQKEEIMPSGALTSTENVICSIDAWQHGNTETLQKENKNAYPKDLYKELFADRITTIANLINDIVKQNQDIPLFVSIPLFNMGEKEEGLLSQLNKMGYSIKQIDPNQKFDKNNHTLCRVQSFNIIDL